ncbi:MAG: chemotaxis protein CheX [Opitutaceae bacterium]|jgi:chemotaxis protein CheX
MEEVILKIFAQSITRYFATVADGAAVLGTPYLSDENESVAFDFSAVIGITGSHRGNIYYTAPREKLHALLPLIGETTPDDRLCAELVGEITNTISGNAREQLGGGFMISTPFIIEGSPLNIHTSKDSTCYILPVTWNNHRSRVLVSLQQNPASP